MYRLKANHWNVYLFATFSTILISCWMGFGRSILNSDGVCYLQSAETLSHGLNAAMHVCGQAKWPFYSILIASVVYLTKCSYINAAYSLNTLFSVISIVMFLMIVSFLHLSTMQNSEDKKNLANSKRHKILLWLAVVVVLCANEFNSVKYYIVRDHGFWAFYLTSLYMLLRYFQNPGWYYSLMWYGSLFLATLFRIEGGIFLILLPFLTLMNVKESWVIRVKNFLQLNSLLFLLGIILAAWVLIAAPSNIGRLNEIPQQFTHGFSQLIFDFNQRADHLSQYLLSHYSSHFSTWVLLITIIVCYVVSVITNVSIIYSILAIYAWFKKIVKLNFNVSLVVCGYILLNVLITLTFLAEHMFLAKRYLIALSLLVMLWVPFSLLDLYDKWNVRKVSITFISLFMVVNLLGGVLEFGYSKKYIPEAGFWLEANTSPSSKIFSNDILVMYYSHRFGNQLFANEKKFKNIYQLQNGQWKQYDYLALRINKKDFEKALALTQELNPKLIQVFKNKRGDQILVYKT